MTAPARSIDRDTKDQARSERMMIVAITGESWGKEPTPAMRRAFAEYMRRFKLDISEVDIIDLKLYRNGNYYRRRIAEMRADGLVDWSSGKYIHIDARLNELEKLGDEWGKEENALRLRERIVWSVPMDATHAYVATVKLKSDGQPLGGCDWITPNRKKEIKEFDGRKFRGMKEVVADPIGAAEPEKTVITRAWRRVGLVVAAEIPEFRKEEAELDAAWKTLSDEIEQLKTAEAEREAFASAPGRESAMIVAGPTGDEYGLGLEEAPAEALVATHAAADPEANPFGDER